MASAPVPAPALAPAPPWRRFADGAIRFFHAYANWLVSISWKRFAVLSVLLLIVASILQEIPPFSWRWTELAPETRPVAGLPAPPEPPQARRREPLVKVERPKPGTDKDGVEISIDERGVRITPRSREPDPAASAASGAQAASSAAASAAASAALPEVLVKLPP